MEKLFSSESVSEGHPDKLADQISDTVLDALIEKNPEARVACECMVKTGLVVVGGEVKGILPPDMESMIRQVIAQIGYTHSSIGLDAQGCAVINVIGQQSADIAQGVDRDDPEDQGAGDQGLMFGYACDETDVLMPAPITYAHRLMSRQAKIRKDGSLPWLRPDAKCQVTFRYHEDEVIAIDTVVLSTQHDPGINDTQLVEAVMETIIKPVLPACWIVPGTRFLINPTGRFVIGGPTGDCGLTGRKIIVDTYGGMSRHGGGAFSGKDPSKVDRSAAYACRYVAKNIVAAGIARRCEIQVAYAIGVAEPVSIFVETFGTEQIERERIVSLIREHFELRPRGIIRMLDLLRPIYRKTSVYGHFGRNDPDFTWEKTDKAALLREEAGLKENRKI